MIEEEVAKSVREGEIALERAPGLIEDRMVLKQFRKNWRANEKAEEIAWVQSDEARCTSAVQAILNGSANEIRAACAGAFKDVEMEIRMGEFGPVEVPVWPIDDGSQFPHYLAIHAEQIAAARIEPRYPTSDRPSSTKKKLRFLARALAAATQQRSTRTAINLTPAAKRRTPIVS